MGDIMRENPYTQIQENELTYELKMLSEICGIETVQKLMENYHGMSFYIPKLSRLDTFIDRYINENTDKSTKEIAQVLSVSEQLIRIRKKQRFK